MYRPNVSRLFKHIEKYNEAQRKLPPIPETKFSTLKRSLSNLWDLFDFGYKLIPIKNYDPKFITFLNRKKRWVDGRLYLPKSPKALVILDAGLNRGVDTSPKLGRILTRMGYANASIHSDDELLKDGAIDYMEFIRHLRDNKEFEFVRSLPIIFIGISGGGIVPYVCMASKQFLEENKVLGAVTIDIYANLADQFRYSTVFTQNYPTDRRSKVQLEYLNYAASKGITPSNNPQEFVDASPETYILAIAYQMKTSEIKIKAMHGTSDKVVPMSNLEKIRKAFADSGVNLDASYVPGEAVHNPEGEVMDLSDLTGMAIVSFTTFRTLKSWVKDYQKEKQTQVSV